MTVQTELRRVVQTGNGATSTFYFNAPVLGLDDLDIYTVTTAGVQTLQTRGGAGTFDYTMTINASTKYATITLNNNLTNGFKVVILRSTAITQGVDYVEGDPFLAETHEGALDRLTIIATQLQEQLDRSVKVVETSTTTGIKISELVADKILVVNSAADGLSMGPTLAQVDTVATNIAAVQTVATNIANVNTVASDLNEAVSEINTVAVNITNVNTVGTDISNVNTAATNIAAINTNATNIVAIQNASANATASAASAAASAASATAAAAALDEFTDTYLGAFSTDPTLDNDGNALSAGDLYFNTVSNRLKVYSGSAWSFAIVDTTTVVTKTSSTGAAVIPSGTTGERDGSPANGYFRYNSSLASFEGYVGGAWGGVGGAQAGGVIFENATTVTASYTLTTSKNGFSVGPVTINSGASVTVPSGQRWIIL
jgi:hypothetical protein